MAAKDHVAVRLDPPTLERLDILREVLSTDWHEATQSDVLRAVIFSGLKCSRKSTPRGSPRSRSAATATSATRRPRSRAAAERRKRTKKGRADAAERRPRHSAGRSAGCAAGRLS